MSDMRDMLKGSARESGGEATRPRTEKKRETAPKKLKTKAEEKEAYDKWGKPTSWKLHPDLGPAVKEAARKYEISARDLAEFLLRGGLELLAKGRIDLPVTDNDRQHGPRYRLERQPPIPREFLE